MIPGKILTFLDERGTVAVGGSRDGSLVPHIHYVSGWIVEKDQKTMCCSIPAGYTESLTSTVENNGQFALTVEQIGPHETYQFKGDHAALRELQEADVEAFKRIRERFVVAVNQFFGFPEEICRAYISPPSLVVRFVVSEIFLQTPGPGAGQRLFPPGGIDG